MDPTKVNAIDHTNTPVFGVLVRFQVVGSGDAVLTLPPAIKDIDAAEQWLFKLGMKMADPAAELSDLEHSFMHALFDASLSLLQQGLQWSVLRTFTPSDLKDAMDAYRRMQQ